MAAGSLFRIQKKASCADLRGRFSGRALATDHSDPFAGFAVDPLHRAPYKDGFVVGGRFAGAGTSRTRPDLWLSRRMLYPLLSGCCLVQAALFIWARTLFFSSSAMTSWGYSMTAVVYFCVLALALVPGTMPNRVGRIPALRFFGRYSYGLYIWHQLPSPLYVPWQVWFIRNIHPLVLGQIAYTMTLLAISTAVAVSSYHLLELRFLKMKSRFRYQERKEEDAQPYPNLRIADDVGQI